MKRRFCGGAKEASVILGGSFFCASCCTACVPQPPPRDIGVLADGRSPKAPDEAKRRGDLASRVDQLFASLDRPGTPGCAVGVYAAGKPLLEKGYGVANLDDDTAIGPDTAFEVASLSKQFTAAAITLLA